MAVLAFLGVVSFILGGACIVFIALDSTSSKLVAFCLGLMLVGSLVAATAIEVMISRDPKSINTYGIVDKENNFIGLDEKNNPVKVDDPRKAKWFTTKQERDKYLGDFYRLRGVNSTQNFSLESD